MRGFVSILTRDSLGKSLDFFRNLTSQAVEPGKVLHTFIVNVVLPQAHVVPHTTRVVIVDED
jgi:hypothetical protein